MDYRRTHERCSFVRRRRASQRLPSRLCLALYILYAGRSATSKASVVKNKRQAERRAREIAEFIQRENWEALAKLHNDGVIDDDEFEKRKRVALGEQSESE